MLSPPTIHLPPNGACDLAGVLRFLRRRGPLQVPDLLNKIVFLIAELLVLGSIRLEVAQELHQLGLVLQQDVQHRLSLVGICDKHLEDVECFKLDVSAVVSQQIHHQLQVLGSTDVLGHDGEVVSIQKEFPKELQRLPFGDVVVRVQELLIFCKHPVVVVLQEISAHNLVSCEEILERGKSVRGDVKG